MARAFIGTKLSSTSLNGSCGWYVIAALRKALRTLSFPNNLPKYNPSRESKYIVVQNPHNPLAPILYILSNLNYSPPFFKKLHVYATTYLCLFCERLNENILTSELPSPDDRLLWLLLFVFALRCQEFGSVLILFPVKNRHGRKPQQPEIYEKRLGSPTKSL